MKKFSLPFLPLILILTSLACTIFVGGPDYSNRQPIPVSTEAVDNLKKQIQEAVAAGAQTGVVTLQINETQITSLVAFQLQSQSEPVLTDPQIYLQNGQMQIYGKAPRGNFVANVGIIVNVGVDQAGQPTIEVTSIDFGPFPAPKGINEAITATIKEAYTGSLGPVATGFRIESISIADGIMTINGRIK